MADDVFGAGEDRNIDIVRQRRKIERGRPGIVDQRRDPAFSRDGGDRWHVLHFKAQRARRFHEDRPGVRSEEHTSELQSLMRISYAVFCLKKKKKKKIKNNKHTSQQRPNTNSQHNVLTKNTQIL